MNLDTPLSKSAVQDLLRRVQFAKKAADDGNLALCEVLYETYYATVLVQNKIIEAVTHWGFDSWDHFVEKEVGMHKETGKAYREVWELFMVDFGHVKKSPWPVSITRLKDLRRAKLTEKNINSWLAKANKLTCCALRKLIHGDLDIESLTLSLTGSEKNELLAIGDDAKAEFETDRIGRALLMAGRAWRRQLREERKRTG